MRSGYLPPYTRLRELSASEWDALVARHPRGHLLQTHAWGRLKAAHGWRASWSALFTNLEQPIGMVMMLTRTLPHGLGRIGYVPRGPVVDWDDEASAAAGLHAVRSLGCQAGVFAVVVEPDLLDTPADRRLLARLGLKPAPFSVQPRRTIWVNLDVDEDVDVLAAMKPKTRYNVGLARRRGVTVRVGGVEDAPLFYDLLRTTANRGEFSIHTLDYYQDFLRLFAQGTEAPACLLIAEYQQKLLAALVVAAVGERAIYLYGASGDQHRDLMPAYLLQWEAMLWARRRGCKTYDLWGVPDADEATLEANFERRSDGLWGVYRFKRGFGGQVVRYIGAWVYVRSPLRWWLFQQACRLRKTTGLAA